MVVLTYVFGFSDPWFVIFHLISDLCLVLCCDNYRSTLISIMYPACMITVHDHKSRALQRRRASREEYSDEQVSDEEIEPCGALCFTRAIRETRMPSGFKLNSTTPKYNGLEEPEAWLDDYLTAVKFQRGTNVTAMQYVQLMLESSALHWLKNLRCGSISSWSQFRGAFIENFKSTYKRPASLEGVQARNQRDLASIHTEMNNTEELSRGHIGRKRNRRVQTRPAARRIQGTTRRDESPNTPTTARASQ